MFGEHLSENSLMGYSTLLLKITLLYWLFYIVVGPLKFWKTILNKPSKLIKGKNA